MTAKQIRVRRLATVALCGCAELCLNRPGLGQTAAMPDAPSVQKGKPIETVSRIDAAGRYFAQSSLMRVPNEDEITLAEAVDGKGEIHLSAVQAIYMALASNLDIAAARLLKPMAKTDLRRAKAGQLLRNVPTSTNAGPTSASGPLQSAGASGFEGIASGQPGLLGDLSVQLAGSQIPRLDPVFYATGSLNVSNLPVGNPVLLGTDLLKSHTQQFQAGVQKGFLSGTTVDANFSSTRLSENGPNNLINPSFLADAEIKVTQPLLQGFGVNVNSRAIHIAKLDERISTFTLRQQVTLTLTQVLTVYYDLETFREQLAVAKQSLERSRALLAENRKRLEMGLISRDDLTESEGVVDANEQLVADAETQIEEQEATLKTMLTRDGLTDPAVRSAHIYPTEPFQLPPESAPETPVNDIVERAVQQRLEVLRSAIEEEISQWSLLGTRNATKPTLNIYALVETNGLAGSANRYAVAAEGAPPPAYLGGFGTAFSQVGSATYPNYEVGFQLNLPITNSAARADNARAQLGLQQQQIQTQQLKNAVRLQATKSALALRQARRQYHASVKSRAQREDTFNAELRMFDLGTTAMSRLIAAQHQLDLARQQEIVARNTYVRALLNLDSVLNETLERHNVSIEGGGRADSLRKTAQEMVTGGEGKQ